MRTTTFDPLECGRFLAGFFAVDAFGGAFSGATDWGRVISGTGLASGAGGVLLGLSVEPVLDGGCCAGGSGLSC